MLKIITFPVKRESIQKPFNLDIYYRDVHIKPVSWETNDPIELTQALNQTCINELAIFNSILHQCEDQKIELVDPFSKTLWSRWETLFELF